MIVIAIDDIPHRINLQRKRITRWCIQPATGHGQGSGRIGLTIYFVSLRYPPCCCRIVCYRRDGWMVVERYLTASGQYTVGSLLGSCHWSMMMAVVVDRDWGCITCRKNSKHQFNAVHCGLSAHWPSVSSHSSNWVIILQYYTPLCSSGMTSSIPVKSL